MPSLFVTTDDLERTLGAPEIVLVDVRSPMSFAAGHIPGAVQTVWRDFSDPDAAVKGLLDPNVARLEARVGALGIHRSSRVIVYTDPFDSWGSEGRVYWMLKYLGHDTVQILDGGWVKWKKEAKKTEVGFPRPTPATFHADVRPELMILKDEMQSLVESRAGGQCLQSHAIVDARSPEEYHGAIGAGIPRGGHVPTAINIPWDRFFRDDGSIKPREELQRVFHEHRLAENQEIICYCTGGVRSAWLLTLLQFAGYPNVRNYPGSWWEWSNDPSLPIEK